MAVFMRKVQNTPKVKAVRKKIREADAKSKALIQSI